MSRARRRTTRCLLSLCLIVLALPAAASAAPGDLDTTYGTDGHTVTAFSSSTTAAALVHLAGDGDVLAGTSGFGTSQFALARYDAEGALDPDFGSGGKVQTALPNGASGSVRAAVAWGSRIVVGGAYNSGGDDFVLAGYDAADGTLDGTFGGDGFVDTPIAGTAAGIDALTVQDLGAGGTRLVAAGASYDNATGSYGVVLARYLAGGGLDTTFGDNGTVVIDLGTSDEVQVRAIAILSGGDLVIAGQHNHHASDGSIDATSLYLARYTALSAYQAKDSGFGTDGEVITRLGGTSARATSLVVGAGDALTVGGSFTPTGQQPRMLVARFTSAGEPDTTFGAAHDGKAAIAFGDGFAFANALAQDADGKVLAAGQYVPTSGGISFALARVTTAGVPDESFASGGAVTTSFGSEPGTEGDPKGVAVQQSGNIVVGGSEFGNHGGSFSGAFVIARYEGGSTQAADPPTVRVSSPPVQIRAPRLPAEPAGRV